MPGDARRRLTILAAISLTCLRVALRALRDGRLGSLVVHAINAQTATLHARRAGLERGCSFIALYNTRWRASPEHAD